MSTIYTFEDIKASCQHCRPGAKIGNFTFSLCDHPENWNHLRDCGGHCDESSCPIIRAILDDGEEWE